MMKFVLTPPIVTKPGIGVSVLQVGSMEFAEPLIITLADWFPADLLVHWRNELGELSAGRRDRCCIVSGLAIVSNKVVPSEWWKFF